MWLKSETMISITSANADLNSVFEIVNAYGSAVIMKNNEPLYIAYDPYLKDPVVENLMERTIKELSTRDASRNFSNLTKAIYDSGLVMVTNRGTPKVLMCDFMVAEKAGAKQIVREGVC